ncbi:hypothetical protein U0070_015940, partial [Myodes glareolus]
MLMFSDSDLLNQMVEIFREIRGKAFGFKDSQDFITSYKTNLGHTVMDSLNEYSHNSFDLQSLLNSFPGDLEFKQIFSDIGEQMGQNAARTCLHAVEDFSSVDVKSIWDDIRLHLRRFLHQQRQSAMAASIGFSVCSESQPEVIRCLRLVLMDAVRDTVRQ